MRNGVKSFVLKQPHFSVNDMQQKHLKCSQCNGFKSEQFPEDGQVESKHVAIDAILTLLQIKERLNTFKLH